MMNKVMKFIKSNWFLLLGLILQTVVFMISYNSSTALFITILSFITAITGVCTVVLGSHRRITTFIFGFIQVITLFIVTMHAKLYANMWLCCFFLFTMIAGVFSWKKDTTNGIVKTQKMPSIYFLLIFVVMSAITVLLWRILLTQGGHQPFMDALTATFTVAAQLLMVFKFREQWFFWIVLDILRMPMWIIEGNWCMAAMYLYWTINCFYGLYLWSKSEEA